MKVHPIGNDDYEWIRSLLCERRGAVVVVSRGRMHHADKLPGFIAVLISRRRSTGDDR